MHSFKIAPFLLFVIFLIFFKLSLIHLASLSKLPKEERNRLIQQYGSGNAQSKSSEQNLNQKRIIEENDEIAETSKVQEKQNNPSENLREMEKQISEDIVSLEISLASEISEIEKSEHRFH